jgi:predicted nucleic acid-binding protein
MRTVFADSSYFFALVNAKDPAHARATAFLNSYKGKMVTTVWVLTELADGLASPANRPSFVATIETLRAEPNISIIPASDELFNAGIEFYRQRPDKEWSLTDCISFVVMQHAEITEALTGDRHFEQAGYIALLK